jgi:hypothetical protein
MQGERDNSAIATTGTILEQKLGNIFQKKKAWEHMLPQLY